jgi:uncharacterized membrane protein (UPF0182 family)
MPTQRSLAALWLMVALALGLAVLILLNTRVRGYKMLAFGFGAFCGNLAASHRVSIPSIIQRLELQPSELDKERPYIEYNNAMTNKAYALDRIAETEYPAGRWCDDPGGSGSPGHDQTTSALGPRSRCWTPTIRSRAIRLYYGFLDIDVDRYMVDGEYRQ